MQHIWSSLYEGADHMQPVNVIWKSNTITYFEITKSTNINIIDYDKSSVERLITLKD